MSIELCAVLASEKPRPKRTAANHIGSMDILATPSFHCRVEWSDSICFQAVARDSTRQPLSSRSEPSWTYRGGPRLPLVAPDDDPCRVVAFGRAGMFFDLQPGSLRVGCDARAPLHHSIQQRSVQRRTLSHSCTLLGRKGCPRFTLARRGFGFVKQVLWTSAWGELVAGAGILAAGEAAQRKALRADDLRRGCSPALPLYRGRLTQKILCRNWKLRPPKKRDS
jgi:hypothetical protein